MHWPTFGLVTPGTVALHEPLLFGAIAYPMTKTGTLMDLSCAIGSFALPNLKSGDEPVKESVIRMTADCRQAPKGSSGREPAQKPSMPPPATEQPWLPPLKYW